MSARLKPIERANRHVIRACQHLAEAHRILAKAGHRQPSRMMSNASQEAANGICEAEAENEARPTPSENTK